MKNLKPQPFLFILLILSAAVWFLDARVNGLDLGTFIGFLRPIPDVITVDLLVFAAFRRWGWRWRFLQGWLVPFPDLSGTWLGELQTTWVNPVDGRRPGPIPVMLTIQQTFGAVNCVMRTAEMVSNSYAEGFCIDREVQTRQLCYSYTSRPKASLRARSTPHDGTIRFNILGKNATKLDGEYWTQRCTTGTVVLAFKSRSLRDELPAGIASHPMSDETPPRP
jgi:hypothetical protein